MDENDTTESQVSPEVYPGLDTAANPLDSVRAEYQARLIAAALRTEAVKAGMIDLDGLKLLDTASVQLNEDDTVADGAQIMQALRKNKPWLFRQASSSSAATAPSSRPIRHKSAMEMSDEEYAAARKALIKS